MSADIQFPGHRQRLIDSGEYVCECGWTPSWHGDLSLNEQIAAHLPEPLDLAQLRPIMESAQAWEGVRVNVAMELLTRLEAAEAKVAAVRELHPESIAYPLLPDGTPDLNAAPIGRVCLACSDESIEGDLDDCEWTIEDGGNVFYPCPTIRALESYR